MVIPIMFLFGILSLLIPGYAIISFPFSSFGLVLVLYSACFYCYESAAEAFSVLSEDVIIGMLNFMQFWFAGFLFGGFLIPEKDLFWPFKFFYYVMPLGYYVRSSTYLIFKDTDWDTCTDFSAQPVCSASGDGHSVLDAFGRVVRKFIQVLCCVLSYVDLFGGSPTHNLFLVYQQFYICVRSSHIK